MAGVEGELIAEVQARLAELDLPDDVRATVMGLIGQHAGRAPLTVKSAPPGPGNARAELRIARGLYKASLRRTRLLGGRMASDTAWNMLLDLFITHGEGRSISVSSLCIASGGPPTTALRQIGRLEADGLVTRYDDERDARRSWVRATPRALELVRAFLLECAAAVRA